ncbi:hypothetical protein [Fulvivirga ligni]|uniref:hypothetical protein n=1 Tax=Fulvivirga ligni TaxID=2904246 RepID=UPI001F164E71|nr:hypothetical protein [Fulvivirga ligni]UII21868.1 hypothetical protein LVD16_01295 [Fulvivirga ligni]
MRIINYLFLACIIVFSFGSCAEDGDVGPAGADGTNGTNGTNGTDGEDGMDGAGFDELTKYGNIMIYLDGTRPDEVAFKDTSNFRFVPIEDISSENVVSISESTYSFRAMRFLSAPDDVFQYSVARLIMTVEDGETLSFPNFSLEIGKDVVTTDFKVFGIYDTYSSSSYTDLVIEDYSYTPSTGTMQFSFSFNVTGANNDTGNDLNVSGEVELVVLEYIN